MLVFPGDIKIYKDPTKAILAMADCGRTDLTVVLAGRCDPPEFAPTIMTAVEAARMRGLPVVWMDRRFSDDELAQVIDAADVVVLPYSRSWNSGFAVLTLERRRRLLCSDMPGFRELAEELSPYWVRVAKGEIGPEVFGGFANTAATTEDEAALDRFIAARQWDQIARGTLDFYEQLLTKPHRRGEAPPRLTR